MTPELAYFLKINVAIALFYAFYRLFFHKDTFFHWRRMLCYVSLPSPCFILTEYSGMDKSSRTNGGNGRSLCNHHPSGASSYSFTRACNELARVYHAAREVIYWSGMLLLATRFFVQLGSIIRLHFQCSKSKIQGVRVHLLKEKNRPFFFLPLDIHTSGIAYRIRDQRNNHA